MFNSNWSKRIALIVVIVMTVMTLAGCQSGRTYEDVPGDASGIYVPEKEQRPEVPYTGESTVIWHKVDDPSAADISLPYGETPDGSSSGSDDSNDTDNSGNDVTDTPNDDNTNETPDDSQKEPADDNANEGTEGTEGDEESETPAEYDPANLLKIISYNVRCADDGNGNDIKERAPRLEKVINDRDPDIIGFQEVTPKWWDNYLIPFFGDKYDYVHKYRSESSKEGTPLMWRKDKFELLDSGHFWLSETPDTESKGWNASHWRICMWVKLKVKATGKTFLYYNTHYDFSKECHVGSANLIIKRAQALGGFSTLPVFFTADCNMSRFQDGYNAMLAAFADVNMDLEDLNYKTGGGYHLDGHEGLVTGSPIDYCFYSPKLLIPLKYQIIDEKVDGGYVSDHKGLYIELAIA